MSTNIETRKLISALKRVLRIKKVKYRDIAKHLNLAESTVKRFMSECDIDLNRLIVICSFVGMSLHDLMHESEIQSELRFTIEQESFLAEHISHLCFFLELNDGKAVEEISSKYKLSKSSVDHYLLGLEQIKLIDIDEDGNPILRSFGTTVMWDDRGPIGQRYSSYYLKEMTARAQKHLINNSELCLRIGLRRLSTHNWKNFKEDIDTVLAKYRNLSSKGGDQPVQYLFISDLWHDSFFDRIDNI
ncbi:MAG: hypothetical protein R3B45_01160 [Bdellovibrionota bacterium]